MEGRIIWIVLDSVGMGAMPDAAEYSDEGSNTLGNIARMAGGLQLPNLCRIGLGNIEGMQNIDPVPEPEGAFCRLAELSNGKDTIIGHWEMVGVITEQPFPVYPDGFPRDLMACFEEAINRSSLGNKAASGTEIIAELGEEHIRTGFPIVYTSADSVFQIAAHEDVIPVPQLYEICETARSLLQGEHAVARVIARPFVGEPGQFTRTANRHDYALSPPHPTLLDAIMDSGGDVIGVGKIVDIFNGQGISEHVHTQDNNDGIDTTLSYMRQDNKGLIFTNLVDFDMRWGHRNNWQAYAEGLEAFDRRLPEILSLLDKRDVLFICADHGCDPTTTSTDHSREYVPMLAFGNTVHAGTDLGTRNGFCDIGQTVADILGIAPIKHGSSFWSAIRTRR